MKRLLVLMFVLVGCGVDRSPLLFGGNGGQTGIGGIGGTTDAGGAGGVGGMPDAGGVGGGGGTTDAGGSGGSAGQAGSGGADSGGPCTDDLDSDMYIAMACGGTDCDDTRSDVHPGGFDSCNNLDDDCNGVIDDGFAVFSCFLPNASIALCSAGRCTVTICNTGYSNCDNNSDNGCETQTDFTPNDCMDLDCAGNVKVQPADLPADDGNDCTDQTCDGSTPRIVNVQDGNNCGSNNGTCLAGVCTS